MARVELLIRASLPVVFSAFTNPRDLKKFWLSKASGPLEQGKTIRWGFKVRGAEDTIKVLAMEPNRSIRVQWSNQTTTEWTFTALGRNNSLVRIETAGFAGSGDAVIADALDSAQGFAFVLSDLKVLLEHKIRSGVVKDKAILIERAMAAAKRKK